MGDLELPPDALSWLVDTGALLRVTEDFLVAMEEASGLELGQFRRWYAQAGTPVAEYA